MTNTTSRVFLVLLAVFFSEHSHAADRYYRRRPANEALPSASPSPSPMPSPSPSLADTGHTPPAVPVPEPSPSPTESYSRQTTIFSDLKNKFFLYQPVYLIAGAHDLKMQLSAMYNFGESFNLNLAHTQLMFWNIYEGSKPLKDVNYSPEIFYRFKQGDEYEITSYDLGIIHNSNGLDGRSSRSVDRIYFKTNYHFAYNRHAIKGSFKAYYVYAYDPTNTDIEKFIGYWDLTARYTNLFIFTKARTDFEFRIYAGNKVLNVSRGGRSLGLIHHFNSKSFNPSLYLQYFSGYAETLIEYNKPTNELRFGLMLAL